MLGCSSPDASQPSCSILPWLGAVRMESSLPNSLRGKGGESCCLPGARGTAGTRDALCKRWPQEKLWLERLCWRCLQEQTPAGLPFQHGGGGRSFFWVTECRGLLTQVTTSLVLTQQRGHLSPPAPEQGTRLLPGKKERKKGAAGFARAGRGRAGRGGETPPRRSRVIQGWREAPGGDARLGREEDVTGGS